MYVTFCILSIFVLFVNGDDPESPIVHTIRGTLQGKYETSRAGRQYESFVGIKYAEIPQRFDVSVPSGSWSGVRNAVTHGPHCAQHTGAEPAWTGVEDCLYLNVFTPKADNEKRGVLVYIHGGGFTMGAGSEQGGGYLVDDDIVLVTLNYRLGILGFLSTIGGPVTGNMGLKDQVEALKWVRDNIEYFGGDKNRVTIAGNSAGGASVAHLLTAPTAQGLFHGVYPMSGTSVCAWAFRNSNSDEVRKIGEKLNCQTRNENDLVNCLRETPLEELMTGQRAIWAWPLDLFRISPSLEVKSEQNPEPFLDETPEERILKGKFNKVPVLLTMAKDEGGTIFSSVIVRSPALLDILNTDYARIAPITFFLDRDFPNKKNLVVNQMREFYFNNQPITRELENNLTEAYTDVVFQRGIQKFAHLLAPQAKVWTGLFEHPRTDYSPAECLGVTDDTDGVIHCEELAYIFSPTGVPQPLGFVPARGFRDEKDVEFSKKFVRMVASFIKTGVPEAPFEGRTDWATVSKAEVDSKTLNWFGLDDVARLYIHPFEKRMKFWDDIHEKGDEEIADRIEL